MNSQTTKTINKTVILKLACTHGTFSRLDLHKWSGLSKMTVTNLVSEFLSAGVMRMAGTEDTVIGRKAELMEVVPDSIITIGVLITHHGLFVAGVGLDGTQFGVTHAAMEPEIGFDEFCEKICSGIDGVIEALPGKRFSGIAISSLGCVESAANVLELQAFYPNVGRVETLDSMLTERYGLPVISENDANVAALAELYYGKEPVPQTFIYIQIDEGIGAGLITDGKLFGEVESFAGEIGHMTVIHEGVACRCGNRGCLECYISTTAICKMYARVTGRERADWDEVMADAAAGVEDALEVLEKTGGFLASGLVSLINIIGAEKIYIGDRGADILKYVGGCIEGEVNRRRFVKKPVTICPATFSKEARIMGVAPLWIERAGVPEITEKI